MNSIIFDVETTGKIIKGAPLPRVIEIGAIYVDDSNTITRTISQLIDPQMDLPDPKMTKKLCGITQDMLIGKPIFAEFRPTLTSFFAWSDNFIAHNARFDKQMLESELLRLDSSINMLFPWPSETYCTIFEYEHLTGGKWMKLTELYEKLMGYPAIQTHRALGDCKMVFEFLMKDNFFDKIYSIELNPNSFNTLVGNIKINHLEGKIVPINGNCKEEVLKLSDSGITADRVVMGVFPAPVDYIKEALTLTKEEGTMYHFEGVVEKENHMSLFNDFNEVAKSLHYTCELKSFRLVKSYGPMLYHTVLDILVLKN